MENIDGLVGACALISEVNTRAWRLIYEYIDSFLPTTCLFANFQNWSNCGKKSLLALNLGSDQQIRLGKQALVNLIFKSLCASELYNIAVMVLGL